MFENVKSGDLETMDVKESGFIEVRGRDGPMSDTPEDTESNS